MVRATLSEECVSFFFLAISCVPWIEMWNNRITADLWQNNKID